jgi:uncharacterized protein YcnI
MLRRFGLSGMVIGIVLFAASPAWAHVTVSPDEASAGSFTTLSFKVPNESDSATTTKVEVGFPSDPAIADASVQPVPGWTVKVNKAQLETPVTTDDGETLDEYVSSITWTAQGDGLGNGEFQIFLVSVGLPDEPGTLTFPALQTYSDGDVVRWVDPTGPDAPEAEHPAPTVTLTEGAAEGDGHGGADTTTTAAPTENGGTASGPVQTAQDDADSAKTLAIAGIVIGAVGVVLGGVALARRRAA